MAIAKQYLLPEIEKTSGVGKDNMELSDDVVAKIITEYAREAGVRNVKKLLEKVSRKVALSMVRKTEEKKEKVIISTDNLTKFIGQPLHLSDRLYPFGTPVGVIMGLAWTSMGGATLYIEATGRLPHVQHRRLDQVVSVSDGKGGWTENDKSSSTGGGGIGGPMKVTGQLGQVMTESSEISLTYARLFARELNPKNSYLDDAHLHLNVPEGSVPKDGPSAGVTMTSALMSLALGEPIKTDLAMTGELTITGKVLKIGGLKEKVIAARREGITTLIFPRQNEAYYTELKEYLRAGITAHFIDHYDDVYRVIFNEGAVPPLLRPSLGLPMLTIVTPAAEKAAEKAADVADQASETSEVTGERVAPPVTPEPMPASTGVAQMSRCSSPGVDR